MAMPVAMEESETLISLIGLSLNVLKPEMYVDIYFFNSPTSTLDLIYSLILCSLHY